MGCGIFLALMVAGDGSAEIFSCTTLKVAYKSGNYSAELCLTNVYCLKPGNENGSEFLSLCFLVETEFRLVCCLLSFNILS